METVKAGGFIIRAACKDDCEHIMTLVRVSTNIFNKRVT